MTRLGEGEPRVGEPWVRYAAGALILAASLSGAACRKPVPAKAYTLTQVGRDSWAAIDNANSASSAGSNAGFVIGTQAVAVVDTFASVDAARQLQADIRRRTDRPIRFVVNTHHHPDHVAGNGVFADAGAILLAQRNVRDWIHTENLRLIGDALAAAHQTMSPEQRASIEAYVAPTMVYDGSVDVDLGGRQLLIRSLPGHTGGDSVVLVPDAHIAFTGDLFWNANIPNLVDASTKPWIDTLNVLAANPQYTFVPGHGSVGSLDDVLAFRDYLIALRDLTASAGADGKSGDAVVEQVVPQLSAKYSGWTYFQALAPSNVQQMDAELRGTKKVPQVREH